MTVAEYYRSLCTDMCDIAVAEAPYDRLTPYSTSGRQDKSLKRTQEHLKTYANLLKTENKGQITHFAPVVGGDSIRRRTQSSVFAVEHDDVFAGYSVRSIPKSGPTGHLLELLNASLSSLPSNKVRMLCGWGSPETVLQAVACGVDVFDGTYPYLITEEGCAMMFHFQGMVPHPAEGTDRTRPLSLYDSVFSNDHTPLLPGCKCFACQHHTRSYLHHLLLTHEMLAQVLLMMHNMHHYWVFFESIRTSITDGTFEQAAADFHGC